MHFIEVDFLGKETEPLVEKRRVLVIDDDTATTQRVKHLLEATGRYIVAEENDPDHASITAWHFAPDVIFMDVVMPQTDGAEVAARFQDDPFLRRIPLIFLTGLVTHSESDSGLRIAGHRYLAKPVTLLEFVKSIEAELPRFANGTRRHFVTPR